MGRMLRFPFLALAALAASGASCPNNQVGLCEAQVRARCELEFRCCSTEERLENPQFVFSSGLFGAYLNSEAECVDRFVPLCKGQASIDDAVAAGRLAFDGDKAQECLAAMTAARDSCDLPGFLEASSTSDEDSPCFGITNGLVDDGDACASDAECAEGGACRIDFDDPDINEELGTEEGECVGPAGVGESCEDRGCAEGLVCEFNNDGQVCVDPPGLGEPCPDFTCDEGLACEFDDVAGESVCVALPGNGEPCTFDCAEGFFCEEATTTCAPQKGVGDACDPDAFDECVDDSFCDDESNTCESFGGGGAPPDDLCTGT